MEGSGLGRGSCARPSRSLLPCAHRGAARTLRSRPWAPRGQPAALDAALALGSVSLMPGITVPRGASHPAPAPHLHQLHPHLLWG